jgi:hypothetical protein
MSIHNRNLFLDADGRWKMKGLGRGMRNNPRFALLFSAFLWAGAGLPLLTAGTTGCSRVKMPEETPGPPGCGLLDPRQTSPGKLSMAQQRVLREAGSPHDVIDGEKGAQGGKVWIYERSAGSQFGESQSQIVYVWSKDGLLLEQKTELLRKVGK